MKRLYVKLMKIPLVLFQWGGDILETLKVLVKIIVILSLDERLEPLELLPFSIIL
jgi:hypothetical protein